MLRASIAAVALLTASCVQTQNGAASLTRAEIECYNALATYNATAQYYIDREMLNPMSAEEFADADNTLMQLEYIADRLCEGVDTGVES